jgi:threonine synthase
MSSVKYCSTRGGQGLTDLTFSDVVMRGLADDGGLFVPQTIPQIDAAFIESLRPLSFPDMACEVLRCFVKDDEIPYAKLKSMVHKSYASFEDPAVVTPVVDVNGVYVLELFRGPTFAFKDVALQMLGNLFEYFLSEKNMNGGRLAVLGATSGDTGSAAIAGLRGKKGIDCVILYPHGKVSEIQVRQAAFQRAKIHSFFSGKKERIQQPQ